MLAYIFPGQGSQFLNMGSEILGSNPEYHIYFEIAKDVTNIDFRNIIYGEDEDLLTLTPNAQVAILTVSYIQYRHHLNQGGAVPDAVAGHSLGEWTALVAAGVIDYPTAVDCVYTRGQAMNEACPANTGAMAAIMGLRPERIEKVLQNCPQVNIANYNCPQQIVISGETNAVNSSLKLLKDAGAKKAIPLKVSGPFHSPYMSRAREKMSFKLANINFKEPRIPLVQNTTGGFVQNPQKIKENIIAQITSPVRWIETIATLNNYGCEDIIEMSPKKVLSSFTVKTLQDLKTSRLA